MSNSQVGVGRGKIKLGFYHTSAEDSKSHAYHQNEPDVITSEPNNGPTSSPRSGRPMSKAADAVEDEVKPSHLVKATKQPNKFQSTAGTIDPATMTKAGNRGKRPASNAPAGKEKQPPKRQRRNSTAHPARNASTANESDASRDAIDGAIRIALHWPIDRAIKFFTMGILKDALLEAIPPRSIIEHRVNKEVNKRQDEHKSQQDGQAQPLTPFKLNLASVKEDEAHIWAELLKIGVSELSVVVGAFKPKYHPKENPHMASYFRQSLSSAKLRGLLQKDEPTLPKPIKQEEWDD